MTGESLRTYDPNDESVRRVLTALSSSGLAPTAWKILASTWQWSPYSLAASVPHRTVKNLLTSVSRLKFMSRIDNLHNTIHVRRTVQLLGGAPKSEHLTLYFFLEEDADWELDDLFADLLLAVQFPRLKNLKMNFHGFKFADLCTFVLKNAQLDEVRLSETAICDIHVRENQVPLEHLKGELGSYLGKQMIRAVTGGDKVKCHRCWFNFREEEDVSYFDRGGDLGDLMTDWAESEDGNNADGG